MPSEQNGLRPQDGPARTLTSEALFAGERTVTIVHGAHRYLLRITRQGKLILNKNRSPDDERHDRPTTD